MLGIIVMSDVSIIKTEPLFPHFQNKFLGSGSLGRGAGAGSRPAPDHGAGGLVTAQPESSSRERCHAASGALPLLGWINRYGASVFERFEEVSNIICLFLLGTQYLNQSIEIATSSIAYFYIPHFPSWCCLPQKMPAHLLLHRYCHRHHQTQSLSSP